MRGPGVVVVLGISLASCGGTSPAPAAPAAAPTCAEVAVHVVETRDASQRTPDGDRKVMERVRTHCAEDAWSVESRRCFIAIASPRDGGRCFGQLTRAQQDAFAPVPPPPPPPPSRESHSDEVVQRRAAWEDDMKAWRAAMAKWTEEQRAWDALPEAQRGSRPPPPPPPPPPQNVAPTTVEANRIAGEKNIVPDLETKVAIGQSGKDKLIGSYKLCLNAEGNVASVVQLKSTTFPAYDQKIISTIRGEWRYRPFLLEGKPTPVCTAVTFIYSQTPPVPTPAQPGALPLAPPPPPPPPRP